MYLLPPQQAWAAGVGVRTALPSTNAHWENRFDLAKLTLRAATMRCLIACLSESMYRSPEDYTIANRWLDYFTSNTLYHATTLSYSLLNTVCTYDPVGWVTHICN